MARDDVTRDDMLRHARLFAALDDHQRAQAIDAMRMLDVPANKILFTTGDAADSVYLIASGEIGIEVDAEDGRTVRIATKGRGEVFGEIAALDGGVRSATARAISASKVLCLSIGAFAKIAESSPAFMMAIIRDFAATIRQTDRLLTGYIVDTLEQRVAGALLDLAIQSGGAGAVVRLTQVEFANRLLATRERVNKELSTLAKEGTITLGRGKIVVHDLVALRRRLRPSLSDG